MKRIIRIHRSIGPIQSCSASSRRLSPALHAPAFSTTSVQSRDRTPTAVVTKSRNIETSLQEDLVTNGTLSPEDAEMCASSMDAPDGELSEKQHAYIKEQMEKRWKYHHEKTGEDGEEEFKEAVRIRLEDKIRHSNIHGDQRPEHLRPNSSKKEKKKKAHLPSTFHQMKIVKPQQLEATAFDQNDYDQASTWAGLDEVGEIMPDKYIFVGFTPGFVTTDNLDMEMALHRAMIEVFAIKQAGLPLATVSATHPQKEQLTYFATLKSTQNGVELEIKDGVSSEQILGQLWARGVEDVPAAPALQHDTFEDLIESWGSSWLEISLEDPEVKFAVLKRIYQLTGNRLPDSKLRSITNAASLRNIIITPPKPKKVADALAVKEELITLPNVMVFDKRQTIVDKAKAVGRWKVITEELKERGLPVPGEKQSPDGSWTTRA